MLECLFVNIRAGLKYHWLFRPNICLFLMSNYTTILDYIIILITTINIIYTITMNPISICKKSTSSSAQMHIFGISTSFKTLFLLDHACARLYTSKLKALLAQAQNYTRARIYSLKTLRTKKNSHKTVYSFNTIFIHV